MTNLNEMLEEINKYISDAQASFEKTGNVDLHLEKYTDTPERVGLLIGKLSQLKDTDMSTKLLNGVLDIMKKYVVIPY